MTLAATSLAAAMVTFTVHAQPVHAVERYEVVHGWPELPPGEILGQATGVDVDSNGNVWVFHRAGRTWQEPFPADPIQGTTVWVSESRTGRLLKSWGAGLFIMPHGLTIDRDDRRPVFQKNSGRFIDPNACTVCHTSYGDGAMATEPLASTGTIIRRSRNA